MSISKEFWISINGTMNGKTLETLHMERLRKYFLTDKQVEDLAEAFQSLLNEIIF